MDVGLVMPDIFNPERVARMSWADISRARQNLDSRPLKVENGTLWSAGRNHDDSARGGRPSQHDATVKERVVVVPRGVSGNDTGPLSGESKEGDEEEHAGVGEVLDKDIDTLVANLVHRSATAEMRERELEARLEAMEEELQRERDKAARMWREEAEERGEQIPEADKDHRHPASEGSSKPCDSNPSDDGHTVLSEYDDSVDKVHPTLELDIEEENPFDDDGTPRISAFSSLPESVGSAGQLNARSMGRPSAARGNPVSKSKLLEGRTDRSIASSFVTDSQHNSSGKRRLLHSRGEYDITSSSSSRNRESSSGGVRTVSSMRGPSSPLVEDNVDHSYSDTSSDGSEVINFDEDDAISMCPSHFSDAPLGDNSDEVESSVLSSDIHLEVGLPPIEYSDAEVPFDYRVHRYANNKNEPLKPEASDNKDTPVEEEDDKVAQHAPRVVKQQQKQPPRPRPQPRVTPAHKRCCAMM